MFSVGLRVAILAAMLALAGCTSPVEAEFVAVNPEGWSRGQGLTIELPNSDTLSQSDLVLILKSDSRYDFDSLLLTVSVKAPDGEQALFRTTLRADSDAEHTNMREWEQTLVSDATLGCEGNYTFRITHSATRKVEGLWALGITRKNE